MNTIAGLYCRRNLVYLHRLALGEISGVRNYGVVPRRSSIIFPMQKNLVRPCVYQYCSSSSTTPTPIRPKSPEEVAKTTDRTPVTNEERQYAFLSKMKNALPHLKDPNDKEERITEYMIHEAAHTEKNVPMTFQEKVVENTRTAWYAGIMLVGLTVLITLCWAIYQELFNRDSPNNIYSKTYKILKKNTEVIDALGQPITCHGEETRPGWRRHVLHVKFNHPDGSQRLRMKFYLKGKFRSATVYLEKMADEKGRLDKYNYLFVELTGYPPRQIHLDPETL